MNEDLKPCPMCGGEAHLTKGHCVGPQWPGEFHRVYCGSCQLRQLFYSTPSEAVSAWNRRPSASIADTAPVEMTIDEASAVEFYAQNPAVALQDFKASYKKLRDSIIGTPEVHRPETTSEHIARDIREGRFPQRSEPQMIADTAGAKPVALTDEEIVRAIRKANIALVNGLDEKAAANAFRSALPDGEALASVKNDPIAWAVPVEIEHLQKGYRNSAVICNRNEGAYTQPVYLTSVSSECAKSPDGHPCNLGEGHEGPCGVSECNLPPDGWSCTRAAGHAGPCAAIKKEI